MHHKKSVAPEMVRIPHLVGYVLGNDNHIGTPGEPWREEPECIWICRDLSTAKDILRGSQEFMLNNQPVWTTIYRVYGENIDCVPVCCPENKNIVYTRRADKMMVIGPVHYQEPPRLSHLCARRNNMFYIAANGKQNGGR